MFVADRFVCGHQVIHSPSCGSEYGHLVLSNGVIRNPRYPFSEISVHRCFGKRRHCFDVGDLHRIVRIPHPGRGRLRVIHVDHFSTAYTWNGGNTLISMESHLMKKIKKTFFLRAGTTWVSCIFLASCNLSSTGGKNETPSTNKSAQAFIADVNDRYMDIYRETTAAQWAYVTYLNEDTSLLAAKA